MRRATLRRPTWATKGENSSWNGFLLRGRRMAHPLHTLEAAGARAGSARIDDLQMQVFHLASSTTSLAFIAALALADVRGVSRSGNAPTQLGTVKPLVFYERAIWVI
jgi:hypothetical protein